MLRHLLNVGFGPKLIAILRQAVLKLLHPAPPACLHEAQNGLRPSSASWPRLKMGVGWSAHVPDAVGGDDEAAVAGRQAVQPHRRRPDDAEVGQHRVAQRPGHAQLIPLQHLREIFS